MKPHWGTVPALGTVDIPIHVPKSHVPVIFSHNNAVVAVMRPDRPPDTLTVENLSHRMAGYVLVVAPRHAVDTIRALQGLFLRVVSR